MEALLMPPTTVIDDEFVSLWYHAEDKVVHHKIKSFLPRGAFEKLLTSGAELLEKHGAKKWLSDDRSNVVITPEDMKWADQVWHPRMRKAGFEYWAIVIPSMMVGAMQLKNIREKRRRQGLTVEIFETVEEAMAWLRSR